MAIEREAAQAMARTSAPPGQIRGGEKEAVTGQHDLEAGESVSEHINRRAANGSIP